MNGVHILARESVPLRRVSASRGGPGPVVLQAPAKAGDADWRLYAASTVLDICGPRFEHTDENELVRA